MTKKRLTHKTAFPIVPREKDVTINKKDVLIQLQTMSNPLRICDTGVRTAAANMTLDRIMMHARGREKTPDTLRFLMFDPPAVLVGRYQSIVQEVRVSYCREQGYDINRRVTGGGAILFDRTCLGWELFGRRGQNGFPSRIETLFRSLCEPVIAVLRDLGLDAQFRGRNDIEVRGKKICGTGGAEEEGGFLFQGTLLVDMDPFEMLRSLRVPVEKLSAREVSSFQDRVTCLTRELGRPVDIDDLKDRIVKAFTGALGRKPVYAPLCDWEEEQLKQQLPYHASASWVYARQEPDVAVPVLRSLRRTPGGVLRCSLTCARQLIGQVYLSGDFFSFPDYGLARLEEALKDCPAYARNIDQRIEPLIEQKHLHLPNVTLEDLRGLLLDATQRVDLHQMGLPQQWINRIFWVNGTVKEILSQQSWLLLLPYCAKPVSCDRRHEKDCRICGECSLSRPWQRALKKGWFVESIVSYEDLEATLKSYQARGVQAFIGSCCEAFWARHQDDFSKIGLPGILVDIDSSTCYDLGKQKDAYKGHFEGETELMEELMLQIIEWAGRDQLASSPAPTDPPHSGND